MDREHDYEIEYLEMVLPFCVLVCRVSYLRLLFLHLPNVHSEMFPKV
jgi:hypothetical protein